MESTFASFYILTGRQNGLFSHAYNGVEAIPIKGLDKDKRVLHTPEYQVHGNVRYGAPDTTTLER